MTDDTTLPPSPPDQPKTSWRRAVRKGLVVLLLIAVVSGGLAYAGAMIWTGLKPMIAAMGSGTSAVGGAPSSTASDIERLRHDLAWTVQQLDETKARLAAIESKATEPAADTQALDGRIALLEKNSANASSVLRLSDRMDRIETQVREIESRRKGDVAQILSIALLREAIGAGRPYDAELRTVKALAADNADFATGLDRLKIRAATGIPMTPVLVERFLARESAILRADSLPEGDVNSWWSRALDRLLTVVSIHREDGEVGGNRPAAIVARAHDAVMHGDLAGAVRELSGLTGPAAETAAPWVADAQARVEADAIVGEWSAQSVAAVGAKL